MNARRYRSRRRLVAATMLAIALGGALVALAACGDGEAPAPANRTLTPDPTQSDGKRGSTATPTDGPSVAPTAPATSKPSPSPTRITDKTIKANVLARIAQEPGLHGFEIRVVVSDRVVYLQGRVRTKEQRSLLEQIALTEPGVKKVVSAIDVDDAGGY